MSSARKDSPGPEQVFGIMKGYDDVKEFLENLGIQYRFSCFHEKNPEGCQFLGDWFDNVKRDFPTATKLYKMNCDKYGFGRSCYKYGWNRWHGKGVDQNRSISVEYFKKACDGNSAIGCLRAGQMLAGADLRLAETIPPDPPAAIEYLKKGCDAKNAEACFVLQSHFLNGISGRIKQDDSEAAKWALKGCELNDYGCCHNLALMYDHGRGVPKNAALSRKFRNKAIDISDQLRGSSSFEMEQGTNLE